MLCTKQYNCHWPCTLALHFGFAPQAEAFEAFVAGDVGEHGLDDGHAVAVDVFACVAVDAFFHPVGVAQAAVTLF